jgi:hypothetical protein
MDTLKMAHLSQQVAGEVVVMNRRSKILAGIVLPLLLIVFWVLSWDFRSPDRNNNGDIGGELKASKAVTSDGISARKPSESKEDLPLIDPFEMIEEFDIRFLQLAEAEGDLWVSRLKGLAEITNRLGKQPDFESLTATALMVSRASDLVIFRLMAGDVSPENTLPALERFEYSIPSEQRMISFVCELHPEGDEERRKNPPQSLPEFVSRFESDPIFPNEEWSKEKTATESISSRNATGRLMIIGAAHLKLQVAKITAIYLQRGGNPHLTTMKLESDIERLVGKEIEKLPVPLFGGENASAATIGFLIENAQSLYQRK